jgi:hypothetical protein
MATKYSIVRHAAADEVVKQFVNAANSNYGSDSYATGYLGALVASIASEYLSKENFDRFLNDMHTATVKQTAQADTAAKYKQVTA